MEYSQRSSCDCFCVPDTSKKWIRNLFEIYVNETNGLASTEGNSLQIVVYLNGLR